MAHFIRQNTCSTCAFRHLENAVISCRKKPPAVSVVLMPMAAGQLGVQAHSVFPVVQSDWWCGEYSRLAIAVADMPAQAQRDETAA